MKIPHNYRDKKMYNNDDIMQEIREANNNTEKLLIKIDGLQAQNKLLTNALEKITIRLNRLERDKEINKQEGYVEADDFENADEVDTWVQSQQ
tara:strand:+ start:16423 stop:16701 length:279 start_codon:yes stop_codon:yes gene_type:complete